MDWTLEVVPVPVSDVDRAKAFYTEKLRFNADHDTTVSDDVRFVQLTPPGSACSIVIGIGLVDAPPGSVQGLQLVVSDIHAAHAELVERGVDVSDIQVLGRDGSQTVFQGARSAGPDPALDNAGFVFFSDPDGNSWAVQQISRRDTGGTPARVQEEGLPRHGRHRVVDVVGRYRRRPPTGRYALGRFPSP